MEIYFHHFHAFPSVNLGPKMVASVVKQVTYTAYYEEFLLKIKMEL